MPSICMPRFLSSPFIVRVPSFLLFGFKKGTLKKKGKRVLLRNLDALSCGLDNRDSIFCSLSASIYRLVNPKP